MLVYRTTTAHTCALLHTAHYLFCSASTLCFYAAFGNDNAYVPVGRGVVICLPNYKFTSNITFVNTRMIRPAYEQMPADQFAKVFVST